ncbi:hypothetical protein CMO92_01555 [Candidatus Woesearchaeota archaeon]|nr:hypothetical protein [Candidatus Woesearchaeota archaeon]|tara:strand:+ start:430 stop:1152 length:723 start_codon:yes stop_codon:yes gene_type:complete
MFCVKCGKDIEQGVFCSHCNPIQLDIKELILSKCECQRYLINGSWKTLPQEEALKALLKKNKQRLHYEETLEHQRKLAAKISYQGEPFIIPIQKKGITCPNCSKKGQYYEAIIQLRDSNEEVIDFIQEKVNKKPGVHINKIEQVTNGYDLYLTSSQFANTLGKLLQEHFGGTVKRSRRLYTKNHLTSKTIYRTTLLFRPHPYKIGDHIEIKGKTVEVTQLGKKPQGKELKTGKKVFIPTT